MSDWDTESLRLTLLFHSPGQGTGDLSWSAVAGGEPERVQRDQRSGVREEQGPWKGAWLHVVQQPGRLDIVVMPVPPEFEERQAGEVRHIGRFDDRRALVGELVEKVATRRHPPVGRLAFGAVLVRHVEGQGAGYSHLKHYLSWLDLDEAASDFLYQVNRPRQLRIGDQDFSVNRLSKWSVAQLARAQILFQGAAVVVNGPPVPVAHACRLELDVSTEAIRAVPIPVPLFAPAFSQFEALAAEIAERGDRR